MLFVDTYEQSYYLILKQLLYLIYAISDIGFTQCHICWTTQHSHLQREATCCLILLKLMLAIIITEVLLRL